jgi:hypothetical protein
MSLVKQTGHGTSSASTDVPPTEVPRVVETGRIAIVWDLYGVYMGFIYKVFMWHFYGF